MKHFFALLLAISLVFPMSTAWADDGTPETPSDDETIVLQTVVANRSETKTLVTGRANHSGGITPLGSSQNTVGSWTIEWSSAAALGTAGGYKYVRHEFAKTTKIAGSGSYKAEAHATLLDGSTYGSNSVFDMISHSCAQSIVVNGTAQTCVSPWFLSSTGRQWFIVSGHEFDIGNNGVADADCYGCIVWVYTTP